MNMPAFFILFVKSCTYCDFTEKTALQFSDGVLYKIWGFHDGQNLNFGLVGCDYNLKVFSDYLQFLFDFHNLIDVFDFQGQ